VYHVSFSPTDPQCIISLSGGKIWQWDVNGHQISPTYNGSHIAFSPDHTQFALCTEGVVTVQNSDSRATVAEFQVANDYLDYCCFSPDGRLIAAAAGRAIHVWDITNSDPYPIETLIGHTDDITSLVFSSSSSLVSASDDQSVKFWKIGTLSTDPVATDLGSTSIYSVSLQASSGIVISSDKEGMVKTWDISTGLCKASFQTPAKGHTQRDVQLIDGRPVIVWHQGGEIHIWDTNRGEFLQLVDMPLLHELRGLRISEDGSKVFCMTKESIQAWAMDTGELVGEVEFELEQHPYLDPLQMDGSRIWIQLKDSSTQGWDFGISGSPPIQLPNVSTKRPLLDFIGGTLQQTKDPSWVKDVVTGKEVFRLSGRYARPKDVRWDGRYLVAGYKFGEVLIFDCHCVYPQ
jgi:WD40 repeat protein